MLPGDCNRLLLHIQSQACEVENAYGAQGQVSDRTSGPRRCHPQGTSLSRFSTRQPSHIAGLDTVKSETSWKDENSIFKGNLLDGPEFACQLSSVVYKVRLAPSFTAISSCSPKLQYCSSDCETIAWQGLAAFALLWDGMDCLGQTPCLDSH